MIIKVPIYVELEGPPEFPIQETVNTLNLRFTTSLRKQQWTVFLTDERGIPVPGKKTQGVRLLTRKEAFESLRTKK